MFDHIHTVEHSVSHQIDEPSLYLINVNTTLPFKMVEIQSNVGILYLSHPHNGASHIVALTIRLQRLPEVDVLNYS